MRNGSGQNCENSSRLGRLGDRPYWAYLLSFPIRALHQVGAAVFLAAYLLDVRLGPPEFYLILAVASGGLLLAAEWWRHRQLHRELAGLATLVKILLLGAAFHGFLPPGIVVLTAFVIASLAAHAPKKTRHRLLY